MNEFETLKQVVKEVFSEKSTQQNPDLVPF